MKEISFITTKHLIVLLTNSMFILSEMPSVTLTTKKDVVNPTSHYTAITDPFISSVSRSDSQTSEWKRENILIGVQTTISTELLPEVSLSTGSPTSNLSASTQSVYADTSPTDLITLLKMKLDAHTEE